jgi:uncharacterized protein YaaR (DUF327 family)
MEAKSFREQLLAIRHQVAEAEEEREQKKREERERTKEKLAEELKQNPPERLSQQLKAIEESYKSVGKRFYPVEAIEECIRELEGFEELVKRYLRYQERYPDIYSESLQRGLKQLKQGIADLRDKIQPQWDQWASVANLLKTTEFRQRQKGDEGRLVEVAKVFHERAHGIDLNIPKSLFAAKRDNFYVAASGDGIFGYFEAFPEEKRVSFGIAPPQGVNFTKLVRGIVHHFCTKGPTSLPKDEVNVRIYSREEVKFYTELGFIRAETLGMSDWMYQKKV